MPRRLLTLIGFGVLAAMLVDLPAARSQSTFEPPPFPEPPPGGSSAVRGVRDGSDPLQSPARAALPAGAAAAPTATFVAPGNAFSQQPQTNALPISAAVIPADARPITGSEIVARVEDQVVLASDVMWQVNQLIAMSEKNGRPVPPEQRAEVEHLLLERMVMQLIDTKLLFADFRRTLPPENLAHVEKTLAVPFEETEIPKLLKTYSVKDRIQLDAALQRDGSSLKDVQRQFLEKTVAGEWLRQRLPKIKVVTHEEMLAYYQDHLQEYEYPAAVKWEELMVRFDRSNGDRNAAWRALAEMGNEVWARAAANPEVRGPVFAEIAKAKSHGFTAGQGGVQETTVGALMCEDLNAALQTLEPGRMSDCIESEQGFHIVRVLERKEAGRTPFTEAQGKIRELLEAEQKEVLVKNELAKLRKTARVWTIFHGDLTGDRLAQTLDGTKKR